MADPTPRPWRHRKEAANGPGWVVEGPNGFCIAVTDLAERGREHEQHAAYIVHCVNLHDELVEALEGARNLHHAKCAMPNICPQIKRFDALLSRARKES